MNRIIRVAFIAAMIGIAVLIMPGRTAAQATPAPAAAAPTRAQLQAEVTAIARRLQAGSPEQQAAALAELKKMAQANAVPFTDRMVDWLEPLMTMKQYDDVLNFTELTITQRAFETASVVQAQKARVVALLEQGKTAEALAEAKGYYNVAELQQTPDAIDIVARAFTTAGAPDKAGQFKSAQAASADADAGAFDSMVIMNMWTEVVVNADRYQAAILGLEARKSGAGTYSAANLISRGNLLLLSDRSADARACFELAVGAAGTNARQLRDALGGVARAIRAGSFNVGAANAFITAARVDAAGTAAKLGGTIDVNALQTAAQQINLAQVQLMTTPPLELARVQAEKPTDKPVSVSTDFECATAFSVENISPSELRLTVRNPGYQEFFLFKLSGVTGRTVRINIVGPDANALRYWWSFNPVYADGKLDLSDPATYSTGDAVNAGEQTKAANGSMLPSTAGQKWSFIPSVWVDTPGTISFVQKFDTDTAYVAMRVPHPPSYQEAWLRQLSGNPLVSVNEVGKSRAGKPLHVVKIEEIAQGDKSIRKPGVLIFGAEHGSNADAMWASQGAIEYLIGDSASAKALRSKYVFLVLPMLDVDAAASGRVEGIMYSFWPGRPSPETTAYANWFQKFITAGNRLDVVINLYNLQSAEGTHIEGVMMEGNGERGALTTTLHETILKHARASGFTVTVRVANRGVMPNRLGGWLTQSFGPICLAYEINGQARDRHLNILQLKSYGPAICDAVGEFLASADGARLLANVDASMTERGDRWRAHPEVKPEQDALDTEAAVRRQAGVEPTAPGERQFP